MNNLKYNMNNLKLERIIKYIIMGLVVILSTRYIPNYIIPIKELIMIGATSSITFAILDMVSPSIKIKK
jgi:hypothetical protein